MQKVALLMIEEGLSIDEVDALTGPAIGRPKSATFRWATSSGLISWRKWGATSASC
jgi:3-hydroxyacyl-CoA dehydrogenase